MKFGKADTLFLIPIAATIALKVILLQSEPPMLASTVSTRLKAALTSSGISAEVVPDPPSSDIVLGTRGRCKLWARDYEPYGTYLSDFEDQAKGYGRLAFIYEGRIFDRAPKVAPLMRFYVARELARAKLNARRPPIIAVAATRECNLQQVDWRAVSEVPW